jgi:PIN domain nuclease of toxin-antitoxin system
LRLLLDSHIFVWWSAGDQRLGRRAEKMLLAPDAELFVSVASWWELAVKQAIGKLRLDVSQMRRSLEQRGVIGIPVTIAHADQAGALPALHGDPFDHMLVAQAICEGMSLLTRDVKLKRYGSSVLCT